MLDNLTYGQAVRFAEIIAQRERRQFRINAFIIAYASGLSFGSIENEEFNGFVDKLYSDSDEAVVQEELNQGLDKAKKDGLPIEDV